MIFMIEQKPQHISKFKKGDLVTRVQPAVYKEKIYNENLGVYLEMDSRKDGAYIGTPFVYKGILNGQIYLAHFQSDGIFEKGEVIGLENIPAWQEGWAKYIDPKTLDESKEKDGITKAIEYYRQSFVAN